MGERMEPTDKEDIFNRSALFRNSDEWHILLLNLKNKWNKFLNRYHNKRAFKALVIGCSAGQDAVSTAMALKYSGFENFEIDAMDIKAEHIEKAKKAEYLISEEPFLGEMEWAKKYYSVEGGRIKIEKGLLGRINYSVADVAGFKTEKKYDLVVIRHVAGSLSSEGRAYVRELLNKILKDCGLLFTTPVDQIILRRSVAGISWTQSGEHPILQEKMKSTAFIRNFEPGKKFSRMLMFAGDNTMNVSAELVRKYVIPKGTHFVHLSACVCPLKYAFPESWGLPYTIDETKILFGMNSFRGIGAGHLEDQRENVAKEYEECGDEIEALLMQAKDTCYISSIVSMHGELTRRLAKLPIKMVLAPWHPLLNDRFKWAPAFAEEMRSRKNTFVLSPDWKKGDPEYDWFGIADTRVADEIAKVMGFEPREEFFPRKRDW